jgi:sugar phosphate isomerase/epimerase
MNRRLFIQKTSSLVASSLISTELFATNKNIKTFGCQLYSVRDLMPKDAKGTMEALAKMGYKQFESYSSDPFWGMSAEESQQFLNKIGVKMISTHMGLNGITESLVEKAAKVGLEYIICPSIGPQKDLDAWKQKASEFNKKGELCKKFGLQFGYHNHSYSFAFLNGLKGQKILIENTDPNLVCFELDMCWSEAAGENTIEHLKQYGNRYELCHVKQLIVKDPKPKQTDLADGIIDYSKLLGAASDNGVKYFFVEQEEYPKDSLTSMKNNANFLKNLKI